MPMSLKDLEDKQKEYEEKLRGARTEIYHDMNGLAWSEKELYTFFGKKMKFHFENHIGKGHRGCAYWEKDCDAYPNFREEAKRVIKNRLNDMFETIDIGGFSYYVLRKDALRSAFRDSPIELYSKSPEYFKMYFGLTTDKEREKIVTAIFKLKPEFHSKELDEWLSEKFSGTVKKIGRELI
jgi:hypothetical protein